MAATSSETKSAALVAFTSAALSLPDLNAHAAVPANQVQVNASYGHYQESDNRMQVDIYHADAVIPLSDRIELAFSLDRDTYSGATPAFSIPESIAKQPKYKQKDDGTPTSELSYVDIVSAASGGVTAAGLTVLGGLNGFQYYVEGNTRAQTTLATAKNAALTSLLAERNQAQNTLDTAFEADKALVRTEYETGLASLNSAIPALTAAYNTQYTAIEAAIAAVPATIDNNVAVQFSNLIEGSYAGKANVAPIAGGYCAGSGADGCYIENGMVFGPALDHTNPNAHLHRAGSTNLSLNYHNDSAGIYIRALNGQAFSLDSMAFRAQISLENPVYDAGGNIVTTYDEDTGAVINSNIAQQGPNEYWEILGFNMAINPDLSHSDGTNYATKVAYQTVANGFNGILNLNSTFRNVNAVWIHYHGYPVTPTDGKTFYLRIDDVNFSPVSAYTNLIDTYNAQLTALTDSYNQQLSALLASNPTALASLTQQYNQQVSALTATYVSQSNTISSTYENQSAQQTDYFNELAKQSAINLYRGILNSRIPRGTPTVQRFQLQPQETRSMPQFTTNFYWNEAKLSLSGGLSDEPDFLSNFGSVNFSQDFNNKLTTVSAGYSLTNNTITRSEASHSASHHANDPDHNPTDYDALNEESTFHSFNLALSQIATKNTLFQSTANFTHQTGYLSNPYKFVYVRGEITAEEYYHLWHAPSGQANWNSITNLEVVGLELFRERRPDQRNMWSFSNRLNQHIPDLDASVHFDYRFYFDDWGINSHTFELKWLQSLPWGLTVTPGIRYYSQSQADFFAPYFLSPRADGNYSSDFRLSAFGDLSGGVTVSKEFARGIKLEAGFEYVTHSGSLKLGGSGVGDYADFDYYLAHANLNIDFSARGFINNSHSHHMHHHGAPIPAGVMFGHMMNQADEFMVGYRFMYNVQSGSMLHGSDAVSDQYVSNNACSGPVNACFYRPTKMHMQMHMLDLMYSPTEWLTLMVMPQLMSMDMTMSESINNAAIASESASHGGAEHTSNDIGDTVVTAMVKVLDHDSHHVHAGLGISAPTGSIDAELAPANLTDNSNTAVDANSATLQDYGMQLGTGTWDFKPSITYTGHAEDWGWGMQLSGAKRLEKNKYGYAYGDLFQTTGWGSYQIFNWLSASVRSVYTWQDKIRGESKSNHENTSPVDFTSNYGGRFVDVGFGLNVTIPDGKFAGNSLSVEWLQPVVTDFNGTQLDRDGALAVNWGFSF